MDNRIRLKAARKKSGAKKTSWWDTIPDLTKIVALITALSALLGLIVKLPDVVSFFAPTFTPAPTNCNAFDLVAYDDETIQANKPKRELFIKNEQEPSRSYMLILKVSSEVVGKVLFKYDLSRKEFEIASVVDQACLPPPESNLLIESAWRGSGIEYEFTIHGKKYSIALFYEADSPYIVGLFRTIE